MDTEPYTDRVDELARHGVRMDESPRTVAEFSIVALHQMDDDLRTLRFSNEPFVDDPAATTRLWPREVIEGTDRDWHRMSIRAGYRITDGPIRPLAVEILVLDLEEAYASDDLFTDGREVEN